MKRSVGYTLLLLTLASSAASAQERRPQPRRMDPVHVEAWGLPSIGLYGGSIGFGSVEGVLRRKEELNLTSDQVARIEDIRKEEVARRQADSRDLIELQSRMAAGLVERTEYRDAMEKRSDAQRAAARSVRNRLEDILTDEQLDKIERLPFGRYQIGPGAIKRFGPAFDFGNFNFDFGNFDFNFGDFGFDRFDFDWSDFFKGEPGRSIELRKYRGEIL